MSQDVFYHSTPLSFKSKDETITINSSWIDVDKVFTFFNSTPYIIMAGSGGGKTTLCMDILHKKAKEATAIYYVSETTTSSVDNKISTLPNAFRSRCTMQNLIRIWQEIMTNKDAYYCSINDNGTNNSTVNTLFKIYNQLINANKLDKDNATWCTNIINAYPEVFNDGDERKSLTWMLGQVGNYLERSYYESKVKDNMNDKRKEQYDIESKHINNCFVIETIQRIIINITMKYPQSIYALSENEVAIINGFYSEKPKTIFIIDDCTEALGSFSKDTKNKVISLDGSLQSVNKAYSSLITSILTRARHCNCMVCMFIHDIAVIPCKDNINNFICFDLAHVAAIQRSKSVNTRTKAVLEYMAERIFSNNMYKYCFIYYNGSIDMDNVYVGKADQHGSAPIEFSPIIQNYISVYDSFNNDDKIEDDEDNSDDFNEQFIIDDNDTDEDNNDDDNEDDI